MRVEPNDVIEFVGFDEGKATALAEKLNLMDRNDRMLPANKILDADAKTFPVVHLEVRLREVIRGMVGGIMLTEEETVELTKKALREAISKLDISAEIASVFKNELHLHVARSVQRSIEWAFAESDVRKALRAGLVKWLEKPDTEMG